MSLDDQLMQKENELLEIKSRIGYIDGNVDQARFLNSATVWLTGHQFCPDFIRFWNLAELKKEYNRWSKIDYFVVPLFVTWCILFFTMTPLETSFQGHSMFDIQNHTVYETIIETIPGSGWTSDNCR